MIRHLLTLRLTDKRQQELDRLAFQAMERRARSAEASARRALTAQRDAERVVVLATEAMKDWDLAGFPWWADQPSLGTAFSANYALTQEDGEHLMKVVRAYRVLAPQAAPIRMKAKMNDTPRQRSIGDAPIPPRPRTPRAPRNLP